MKKLTRLITTCLLVFTLTNVRIYAADTMGVYEGQKASDGNLMSTITMIAIAAVARGFFSCRTKTSDTLVAAAAGGAFVAGEIITFLKFKEIQQKTISYNYDENGILIDADKTALLEERRLLLNAMKTIKTKKNFQNAAAAGFTAAAGLAIWGKMSLVKAKASCLAAANAATASCGAEASSGNASVAACLEGISSTQATAAKIEYVSKTHSPSSVKSNEIQSNVIMLSAKIKQCLSSSCAMKAVTSCELYAQKLGKSLNRCTGATNTVSGGTALRKVFKLIFPEACAFTGKSLGSMIGLGAVGVGIYMGVKAKSANFIDLYMATYEKRVYVFGAMAALALLASKETGKKINDLKKQIGKIDDILASVGDKTGGIDSEFDDDSYGGNTGGTSASSTNLYTVPTTSGDMVLPESIPCITPNCSSVSTALNRSADEEVVNSMVSTSSGSKLLGAARMTSKTADSIQGKKKLSSATLGGVAKLGSQSKAVRDAFKRAQKAYNKMIKKNGGGGVLDFGASDKIVAAINKKAALAISESGYSPNSSTSVLTNDKAKGEAISDKSLVKKVKVAKNVKYQKKRVKKTGSLFDEEKKSEKGPLDHDDVKNGDVSMADALERYETGGSDIIQEKNVPIWSIISNRYIRSAFKKVFDSRTKKNKVEEKQKK
ncbi:MAG: hypothetical protein KAQ98_09505 [Bacteriovoracaceae bacterium]|nr:hypothetical protein [Bacteriovoracaceae bacterium]